MAQRNIAYSTQPLMLAAGDDAELVDNLLFPDGEVMTTKGAFTVDSESWANLKAEFDKREEVVIDWEHASVGGGYTPPSGKAPAAGWIKALRYEEGVGIIASVKWNPDAREMIRGDEYKYWSPAILMDDDDKRPTTLMSVGLTNVPAIYDMPALAASDRPQESDMKKTVTLKPEVGLRHLIALQDDELPQFPAISADQQAVTRLLDMLNEKGAGLEDGATLADVIAKAIEMLGAEGGEGDDEGMAPEAEKALRAELGLDEDGDIMATVKELKAEQAALVLKAGSAENSEARLKELEAAEAKRVEAYNAKLIQDAVDANRINPNDKPQMEAAALILKSQGEEAFTALVGGLKPYAEPGQAVTDAGKAKNDKRTKLITLTAKEWEDDKSRGSAKCSTYVGVALAEEDHKKLTDAEAAKLDGKDGE